MTAAAGTEALAEGAEDRAPRGTLPQLSPQVRLALVSALVCAAALVIIMARGRRKAASTPAAAPAAKKRCKCQDHAQAPAEPTQEAVDAEAFLAGFEGRPLT